MTLYLFPPPKSEHNHESLSEKFKKKIEIKETCWQWNAFKISCFPIIRVDKKSFDARHFIRSELKCEETKRIVSLCKNVHCCNPSHQVSFGSLEAELLEFQSKLIVNGPDECWGWSGTIRTKTGKNGSDRPRFSDRKGKVHYAYRWFCKNFFGLEDDKVVMHTCDNSMCMNPEHWKIGTQQENVDDMINKWRHMHGVNHTHTEFTVNDIRKIRHMRNKGTTYKMLSDLFGVSTASLYNICERNTWKHVE